MKKIILISLIILHLTTHSSEKIFETADSLFQKNECELAINYYNKILENNLESPEIYYNLGICYFKIKEYKNSKINFQKSLILNPKNKLSEHWITQINKKINEKNMPQMFHVKWRDYIVNIFDTFTWILISFALILLLAIIITLKYLFNKKVNTVLITFLLLNLIVFYFTNYKINDNKKIFESQVPLTDTIFY